MSSQILSQENTLFLRWFYRVLGAAKIAVRLIQRAYKDELINMVE